MNIRAAIIYLLLASPVMAQGFAGMGSDAEGFAIPQPGISFVFPGDHGPHPEFRIEWWYVTANLQSADGQEFGAQWTLFRAALAPTDGEGWQSPQIWMGHAAVTSKDDHHVAERLSRGGIGQAGVSVQPFEAYIDDWKIKSVATGGMDELSVLDLHATGTDFAYDLRLAASGPIITHGQGGYSVKSTQGLASYYYSQPSYKASGSITTAQGKISVAGVAWLDREWSSQPLTAGQSGWDWFSLHLDDGSKIMVYRLRDSTGDYTSGTFITAAGQSDALPPGALKVTPLEIDQVADRGIPMSWRVELASKHIDVTTHALNPQSWMATQVPYWEGPVTVEGSHSGKGYVEMTGYQ